MTHLTHTLAGAMMAAAGAYLVTAWSGVAVIQLALAFALYLGPMVKILVFNQHCYQWMVDYYDYFLHEQDHDSVDDAHAYARRSIRELERSKNRSYDVEPLPFPIARERLAWYALVPILNLTLLLAFKDSYNTKTVNGMFPYYLSKKSEQETRRKERRSARHARSYDKVSRQMDDPILSERKEE